MGESSEEDDLDLLKSPARLESCKRPEIILTYTRHHWRSKIETTSSRNINEQELESFMGNHSANGGKGPYHETSHEQNKDEISSMVTEKGEANISDDVQVIRANLISSVASTSSGYRMVKGQHIKVPKTTTPKIDVDVKSWDVPAPATPDIVTRMHGKRMMSSGKCELTEDVIHEPKKTCRRSLSLDMRNLKRKAQNNIDDNSLSKASILLSQVHEHDPKMTKKVHDAKDFGFPRSVLVYNGRKQVKNAMKKPNSECNEESDEEERECQKSEKESLRRLIQLFISRMHHFQGERKFSQWKGSVLDSIGGAYLAQNVNDTLSSAAFMSLAAKFPREAAARSPVEASSSKMRNDNVVLNVKEKKKNAACRKNVQKGKSAEKGRCSKTRNSRRQKMKRKHNPVLLNVLKDCHSKYYIKENTFETSEATPEMSEAIDWDSVRMAKVADISEAIQIRGMNNNLAARIKNCLEDLVKNFGSTDMEWIRDVPSHKAKEYLLSIYGLGLKSVECIRLLTLRQQAFPIDRNAGRVAVRLGWVPLKQLLEGEEFHLLKEYPKLNSIQMYLWQHLSDLDFSILYELHCQMITFGKVFCTQRNPNCYGCPMKEDCKHFASVQASESAIGLAEMDIEDCGRIVNPVTYHEKRLKDDVQKSMSKKNIPLKEAELSSNLLFHTSEMASISMVKKKNVTPPLSTELQVYVLPDGHDLLAELESRELDDPCPYLLAVWTPESLEKDECIHEEDAVYGTLLIPARTATRGIFPLNGTFFQDNEIFADDESSEVPIKIPRASLKNLSSTTLYCGKSMLTICRGMTGVEVQKCFKTGFACFRGFNKKTREPKPLPARFHPRNKKITTTKLEENDA